MNAGRLFASRLSRLSAGAAFLLLVAGGSVTSTGSSLAVPDWPLSYGQVFPAMKDGVLFEHGHRMIAATVGVLVWVLAAAVWLCEKRRWVRNLALAAAGGVVLQAGLGGITVLYGLPPAVSILHACLGQTLFCLLLVLADALPGSPEQGVPAARSAALGAWRESSSSRQAPGRPWGWTGAWGPVLVGAVFLQLVLGAVLRHTSRGLGLHLLGALLASAAILRAAYGTLTERCAARLTRPALWLTALLPIQVLLGLAAFLVTSRPGHRAIFWGAALPTGHVACGALILGVSVLWALRARSLETA